MLFLLVIAVLCNRAGHYIFILWFLLLLLSIYLSFFSRLISAVIDWMSAILHTWCGLSANLRCRSKTCCRWLAANTGRKKSSKLCHLGTIAQLCRAISLQLRHVLTHTHTHNRFTALFPGPPGWAGARRERLDFMVQGKINRGRHSDHPAGRHATPSRLTSAHLHHLPPYFLRAGCRSCHPTNSVKALKAKLAHSDYEKDDRVLLNGVTCTISVP